ncbi:MAG TPA: tetratricopeptide repeat protein, partial [Pirellulaceae bacterium]|nr:tetratricopeptide repeat protein [Pirellulaceae bacterium]
EICQRVASRYGISTDRRWLDSALVTDLDASQRRELLESLGETFVLWQHAQAAEAARRKSSPDEERAALRAAELWNLRAETCFAPGSVPQFINLQRTQLQARLSSGQQVRDDAIGGQSGGERGDAPAGDAGSGPDESVSTRDKALGGVGEDSTAARDSLVGAGSRDARDRFLSAVADMHRRRFADATRTLETLTAERPNDARYWTVLGHCKLQQGGLSEAVHCYTVAIALWPRAEWLYFNRGTARLEQKQFEAAEQDFDAVLELQPNSSSALINRALARFGARRFEGAIADLDAAERFEKAPTRLYFIRSRVKQAAGDAAGAQADLSEGLRRQPTDDASWVARGLARLSRDPQGAMNDFD